MPDRPTISNEMRSRYRLDAIPDWRDFLHLLDFEEGFAFVPIFVPDEIGAEICLQALEHRFSKLNQTILYVPVETPRDLADIAVPLLDLKPGDEVGAIWVEAARSKADPDFAEWAAAWREGVAKLNQFRNTVRRNLNVPLLFVAAPWTQPIMRDMAPDLWSVRTLVVRVEPPVEADRSFSFSANFSSDGDPRNAPDPELALKEAEKLRGRPGEEHRLAELLLRAGRGFNARYEWSTAETVLWDALQLQKLDSADALSIVKTELELSQSLRWLTKYEEAIVLLQGALLIAESNGLLLLKATTLELLGDILLVRSEHEEAQARYEEAKSLFERTGDILGQANCIQSLGDIALRRSDYGEARTRYEEAKPLFERIGEVIGQANCIKRMGDIALSCSDHTEARACYEEAKALYERVGDVLGQANCIQGLGDIALDRADSDIARTNYEKAMPLYERVSDLLGQANCIQRLGDIALFYHSDYVEALMRYEQAQPLFEKIGSLRGQANCIARLGDIALVYLDYAAAQKQYEQAQTLYERVGDLIGQANCIQRLGSIALGEKKTGEAKKRYIEAISLYDRIPEPYSIGLTYQQLAQISEGEERIAHLAAARAAWESIERPDLLATLDKIDSLPISPRSVGTPSLPAE